MRKGSKMSLESRLKMSESHKGHTAWNKGRTGVFSQESLNKMSMAGMGRVSGMKGKKHSEETRLKISTSNKGKISAFKGKKHSEETRKKMSLTRIGRKSGMAGKHHSIESRKKMSESKKRHNLSKQSLENMSQAQKKRFEIFPPWN